MFKVIPIAAFAALTTLSAASDALKLQDLTVANTKLPNGCALATAPRGLATQSNPWLGTNRNVLAQIREHMYGPLPLGPDGPPLNRRSANAFVRHSVDDVSEGYAAFYQGTGDEGVAVYALTFADTDSLNDPSVTPAPYPKANKDRVVSWLTLGQTRILIVGNPGQCADVIQANVRSLMK
jgi:hypothetical protein